MLIICYYYFCTLDRLILFDTRGIIVVNWYIFISNSRYVLYDDMCHLGPFSQNPVVLNLNEVTKFFGSRHLAVDCLHFLNHKDKVA